MSDNQYFFYSFESKIAELEAENQELRYRPMATPAIVESIHPPIVRVHTLRILKDQDFFFKKE
jgi:hypothetical protein